MLVLGIESSCDETGVALYDSGRGLLAHALHSQVALHAAYGGVVPELASRDHARHLLPLVQQTLAQGGTRLQDLDAVAVTAGPGLAGALLVGCGLAGALGLALGRPVIGVHHLEGHLLSPLLADPAPEFPFLCLLVSGGHTQLLAVDAPGRYRLLGETLDDAAGEAFDKAAQMLGLGYPGGPAISRLAETADGDGGIRLPRPMRDAPNLDFSFSGLKTAVREAARRHGLMVDQLAAPADGEAEAPDSEQGRWRARLARAFVEAAVDVLVHKVGRALAQTGLRRVVVAGGVGANRQLRAALHARLEPRGVAVFYPPAELCTDNGAMIAYAGAVHLRDGRNAPGPLKVRPRWSLEELDGG
jgi:N6-L-threonylcarbamoyladenine synthase